MAPQPGNPFNGATPTNGWQGANAPQRESYTWKLALDNLIRRELKVGDPGNAEQVAQALLARYQDDPRAQAIAQEARGLPFLLGPTAPAAAPMPIATASSTELKQALDDLDRDLQELTTNSLVKGVTPEIRGWEQAIRTAVAEGTVAARFGLDPRQRDKTFAIRRQLGDYARLARFVGALTPTLSLTYRKLAQSLDEVAAVLLVMAGEALASVGFSSGHYLLQVPFMQMRRDVVINALRNLVGSTQEAFINNDWAYGLDAYRKIYEVLEKQGQGDLRALLQETELAGAMDRLIERAAHGTAEGLRALGATAQLDIERFRRLLFLGRATIQPSPQLTAFLDALGLFIDAFAPAGGRRLLIIARPPILFYGLYNIGLGVPFLGENNNEQPPDYRLLGLLSLRGQLAAQLDCLLGCQCDSTDVCCQILFDKILYDVDRAIDLYAVGTEGLNEPEFRASAYAELINHLLDNDLYNKCKQNRPRNRDLETILKCITYALRINLPNSDSERQAMVYELMIQQEAQKNWKNLIGTMAPNCLRINGGDHSDVFSELDTWIQETLKDVSKPEDQPKDESPIPLPPATSLKGILDVLKTMAPQQSGTGGSEGGSGGGAQGTEGGGG